jgi:hypothetical protein
MTPSQSKNWGDIAVLRFEGRVPPNYHPAALLETDELLKPSMEAVLAGYGFTQMRPEIIEAEALMAAQVVLSDPYYALTEIKFDPFEGRGSCHGDSGGPAFIALNQKLYLVGVTSRSATPEGGLNCLEGSIYTSIPGQIDFIKTAMKELNSANFVPGEPLPQPLN